MDGYDDTEKSGYVDDDIDTNTTTIDDDIDADGYMSTERLSMRPGRSD